MLCTASSQATVWVEPATDRRLERGGIDKRPAADCGESGTVAQERLADKGAAAMSSHDHARRRLVPSHGTAIAEEPGDERRHSDQQG